MKFVLGRPCHMALLVWDLRGRPIVCARVLEASSPQTPFLTGKVDFHQVLPTQDVGVEVAVLRDGREAGQVQEGGDVNHLPIDVLVAGPRLKRRPRTGVSVTALSDLQSRVLLSDAGSVEGSMRENSTPPTRPAQRFRQQ